MTYQKRYSTLFLFTFFLLNISLAQDTKINDNQKVNIDHFENIYVTEDDNFTLISPIKNKEYQNGFLGNISSVDVSNPLRILSFHKEANHIVFLNNELSIIGEAINLDELNLPEVTVVCASQINGFWIYNELTNRVEYYNSKLEQEHSSIDLSQKISSSENIQEIKMSREMIYLRVKDTGILVFDMFASYIKTIPIFNTSSFQVLENSILYSSENNIINYDFIKLENDTIFSSDFKIGFTRTYHDNIFYLSNKVLKIKQLNNIE